MKTIKTARIKKVLKKLIISAAFNLPDDIKDSVSAALLVEKNENAKKILGQILENSKLSKLKKIPLCQDCGTTYIDIYIGEKTCIENFSSITEELNEAVKQAYEEAYLRKSIVSDPLYERKNTFNNSPAIINFFPLSTCGIKIEVFLKGAGSDNCSWLFMSAPSTSPNEIVLKVKELVIENVTKACPPVIIGIGIGASASKAPLLAFKAAFRDLRIRNEDERYASLEKIILNEVNSTKIGPAGLGGNTTALAVNIEYAPCHMASLPVAVFFLCHSARRASSNILLP